MSFLNDLKKNDPLVKLAMGGARTVRKKSKRLTAVAKKAVARAKRQGFKAGKRAARRGRGY
jgi:hypothetical protein